MAIVPADVLAAIKVRLETISGLQCRDRMPELVEPPMAVTWLDAPVEFDEAMGRGLDMYRFSVLVFIERADSETAQTKLLEYVKAAGSTSVKAALEGGTPVRTIGGTVQTCRVTSVRDIGVAEVANISYLFAEFELETHG